MISFIQNCCFILKIVFPGLLFAFGPALNAYSQTKPDSATDKVYPFRIHQDFEIKGNLSNPIWEKAKPVFISHEFTPNDQALAPVQTKVKVLYSDHYLYVGFWASDPQPSKIRAHIANRDAIGQDDFVLLVLDPFNTHRHAYELAINPQGIQLDAKQTPHGENFNFDMLWDSKGAVSDSGYTAVMKIPFESIHFPDKNIQNWTINFWRIYPRDYRYQLTWTHLSADNSCLLCQAGELVGIADIQNSNPVNIIPYALGYKSSRLNDPDDPASGLNSGSLDGRIGGTITYSPTSTSSLDATINPDFSQIETDATQISVNNTFAINYSEKRPFFLKKADVFQNGYNLFYSRTINRPWAAAKYTQTAHKYSIGFLTAYDRNTPFIIPGLYGSSTVESDVNAYDNILRGKYNLGSQSHIGGLVTTRNEKEAHNYMSSIDWNLHLGGYYYFSGNAAYSNTKELNDTTLFNDSRRFGRSKYDAAFNGQKYGGTNLNLNFSRQAKYYNFGFHYNSTSPTFQAQNGFVTFADRRLISGYQEYDFHPNKKWISLWALNVEGSWRYNFANAFMERQINLVGIAQLAGQTTLTFIYLPVNDERFRGRFFTGLHQGIIQLSTSPVKNISFEVTFIKGRHIYRTLYPKYGHGYTISASSTIKPVPRLQLDLSFQYSTLSSLDRKTRFYSGSISRLEGHYNFSRHLHFRLIGQYNSFSKQIQVYPLLSYKLNPFTKFYIGMTDNLQHVKRFGPPRMNGYRQINREFFIKVQYLFRK